jgi:predicted nucleic acid-binding protein
LGLLDTNVLSELRKPRPEPKVVAFVDDCPLESLYISVVTAAEVRFGIELVVEPNRRAELNDWLIQKVRPMFENRILPVTEDIATRPHYRGHRHRARPDRRHPRSQGLRQGTGFRA